MAAGETEAGQPGAAAGDREAQVPPLPGGGGHREKFGGRGMVPEIRPHLACGTGIPGTQRFQESLVTIQNKRGAASATRLRRGQSRREIRLRHIYVHKEAMPYYNFLLEGRPYMNVRSILGLLSMGTSLGDTLEFIATGSQAEQALEALAELLTRQPLATKGHRIERGASMLNTARM